MESVRGFPRASVLFMVVYNETIRIWQTDYHFPFKSRRRKGEQMSCSEFKS